MRPFTHTISFDEALTLVSRAAAPIARTEIVAIDDAAGRVTASDVISPMDVPAFDRAAMDGYAVVAADTRAATPDAPVMLACVGRIFGGETPMTMRPGQCVEVATGAPLPPGADAVVMVEQTTCAGDRIGILREAAAGGNIGRRGADIPHGGSVVRAGQVLTPGRVGAIAAIGADTVAVYARPTVSIVSTGNEVVPAGRPLGPGQVYDINQSTIAAVVRAHGGVAVRAPFVGDSIDDLAAALDAASRHDIVVFSGGSSVGEHDLMIDALRTRGEVIFHGIAVKPGKPVVFGRIGRMLVFGMPGYPASCLSSAYTLLVPLLRANARLPQWEPRTVQLPLARRIKSTPDRRQFYAVRIVEGTAAPAFKASGDITSLADADGYIDIPVETEAIEAGTVVTVICF